MALDAIIKACSAVKHIQNKNNNKGQHSQNCLLELSKKYSLINKVEWDTQEYKYLYKT